MAGLGKKTKVLKGLQLKEWLQCNGDTQLQPKMQPLAVPRRFRI